MELSQRMQNVVESQTIAMTKKARELKSKGHDVISLSIGEPDFDTPEVICNSANRAMGNGETHYPPVLGTVDFRTAIKNKLLKENNIEVELDEIIVSNGATEPDRQNGCIIILYALAFINNRCILANPWLA